MSIQLDKEKLPSRSKRGRKLKDRTGEQFGEWTLIDFSHTTKKSYGRTTYWKCKCTCGNASVVSIKSLMAGKSTSCGCARHGNRTHNMSSTLTYKSWQAMKERCYNPKAIYYHNYGGRGISVCARWKDSFENFYKDMGERPSVGYSLDRENNEDNYSPDNCKWASKVTQANNRRNNRSLTYKGITMNLGQWAKKLNIDRTTLRDRLKSRPHDECFAPKIPT